ncbi:glycosyl transferase [Novosphingobium marinum]|uniref:Sugar transferase (PEP-CTERM/EpsH1 system associated) n=1 Tax=Novosphingobium marinum TaxID=1514948 RepID=A0A7Z0BTH2_9SPHN|nr:TIGR03087 family PEP-CTERM/XrtA system glycosyltransferase [Novosphingobium marinum]NYH94083.1 sugar transferase (PEP-CTERM/EpsH1 system associated) [Novosphingobium marinum]GGC19467.1 glycosyl transferase [Novosphingobium marinum]
MGEILFIAHRVPFPPDRGDKIRSHHILKKLAGLAPVHVATFGEDERDMAAQAELAVIAASHRLVRRSKPLALAGVEALMRGRPVSVAAFHSRALQGYIDELLATRPVTAIYVFSGQMGQYVPDDFGGRVIVDLVDVDSAKFEAYAQSGSGPMRFVNAREGRLLRNEEARLSGRADRVTLISRAEAELFASRLPMTVCEQSRISVLGNGIDSVFFDPAKVRCEPRLAELPGPRIVFTGQMDYAPNVAAAFRAMDEILPRIRQSFPDASLHIVGRNPPARLSARDGAGGVHVWGAVEDMRTWLKGADLALVPLSLARGVQNKVLEAMAMELPLVLTPEAATGIDAADGRDFAIAESDTDIATTAIELLEDEPRATAMGSSARRFVVEHVSWDASLTALAEIVGLAGGPARHAA